MDASLAGLHKKYPHIVVLNVNIRDWNSPVSQQFGISSVPHLIVYDNKGRNLGSGERAMQALEKVMP